MIMMRMMCSSVLNKLTPGLNLFVYDYPGYGKSSGASSEASVMKAGEAALDWVSQVRSEDDIVKGWQVLRSKGRKPSELL